MTRIVEIMKGRRAPTAKRWLRQRGSPSEMATLERIRVVSSQLGCWRTAKTAEAWALYGVSEFRCFFGNSKSCVSKRKISD